MVGRVLDDDDQLDTSSFTANSNIVHNSANVVAVRYFLVLYWLSAANDQTTITCLVDFGICGSFVGLVMLSIRCLSLGEKMIPTTNNSRKISTQKTSTGLLSSIQYAKLFQCSSIKCSIAYF